MRGGLRSLVPDRVPEIVLALLALVLAAGTARGELATTRPVAQPDQPFPVAAFFQPVRNLDALKAMGVNTVIGPEIENAGSLNPIGLAVARDAWLKATADRGLKVILKNPPPTLPAHVVGLMISQDEPDAKAILPAAVKAESDALRKAYPGVPVFLSLAGDKVASANFNGPDELQHYKDYAALADVLTIKMYGRNRNATQYTDARTGETVKKLALASGDKPVWVWLEVNDQQLPPPQPDQGINRAPMPDEIKATWEDAVKSGAKGVGAFLTCDAGKYGWPASYFPQVDRNGASMKPQYDAFAALARAANPTLARDLELQWSKAKAALDQSEADRKTAATGTSTLTQTLKDSPPPKTEPGALYLTVPAPRGDARFKPYAWGHGAVLNSVKAPGVRVAAKSPYEYEEARVRAFARLCRDGGTVDQRWIAGAGIVVIAAGSPLVIDVEGYHDPNAEALKKIRRDRPDLDKAKVAAIFRRYVLWARDEVAGKCPVGVIGYPLWDGDADDGAVYRPVHDACDFIVPPDTYTNGPQWQERDFAIARAASLRARKLYPDKPQHIWLNPLYADKASTEKTREVGARELAHARELAGADGAVVIWTPRDPMPAVRVYGGTR